MIIAAFGVIIHVIFLASIFDIYFKSPLIHGMIPYSTPLPAPAKRVVLFVADGLRADRFFELDENGGSNAPFLRDITVHTGAWGISHTRVPTESRPGNVAIVAGIFEDVSAVTRGWQENPVDFDSVFNESRYTWAWGSPDILHMFAKGPNVFAETYASEQEDFAKADPSNLDTWVFEKFEMFIKQGKLNETLSTMLSKDKVIFFFHLLGLDTSGHAYKPGSKEYRKNIEVVDRGIEKCVGLIEEYFENDEQTAYLFTSDHGMTDWGSHGAGQPQETHTPFVAWGAGVRGPLGEGKDIYYDGLSELWKLSQVKRVDINQVDIAPLVAALIGIPFPVNSMGILPVEYLGTEWSHKSVSLLTNARQILAHYKLKMKLKRENTLPIFFRNFKELSVARQAELMSMIETLLRQDRYRDAIQVGLKLIELALKGLDYYHRYDRLALSFSIFLGFLGWMSYVVVILLQDYTPIMRSSSLESSVVVDEEDNHFLPIKIGLLYCVLACVVGSLLYVQSAPVAYYAYFFLPILLWFLVTLRLAFLQEAKQFLLMKTSVLRIIGTCVVGFVGLEILVMTYFKRELLSLGLWAFAMWPFSTHLRTNKKLCILWFTTCTAMSMFPILPVVGRDSHYSLVVLAGWLGVLGIAYCARRPEMGLIFNSRLSKKEPQQVVYVTAIQVTILCIATFNVRSTSLSISSKEGLPLLNQIVSWLILASSLVLPLFGSKALLTRLLNVMTSLLSVYLLLCITHEGLFCLSLCILMFLWICVEHDLSDSYSRLQDLTFEVNSHYSHHKHRHSLSVEDLRRAYFFIFFILLAFFGTGNIASINSFEPSSVYCFLTVFSPFVMGFLMLLKVSFFQLQDGKELLHHQHVILVGEIVIPFLIVSCSLRAILITLKLSHRALFLLTLLMSDFIALHFFFMVQDTGSWLEIGSSISHYVINITVIIFIMLLYGLALVLTSCNLPLVSLNYKRHVL